MTNKVKLNLAALLVLPYLCAALIYGYGNILNRSVSEHAPSAIKRVQTEDDIEKLKELVVAGYETADLANKVIISMSNYYSIILLVLAVLSTMAVFNIYRGINYTPSNK